MRMQSPILLSLPLSLWWPSHFYDDLAPQNKSLHTLQSEFIEASNNKVEMVTQNLFWHWLLLMLLSTVAFKLQLREKSRMIFFFVRENDKRFLLRKSTCRLSLCHEGATMLPPCCFGLCSEHELASGLVLVSDLNHVDKSVVGMGIEQSSQLLLSSQLILLPLIDYPPLKKTDTNADAKKYSQTGS